MIVRLNRPDRIGRAALAGAAAIAVGGGFAQSPFAWVVGLIVGAAVISKRWTLGFFVVLGMTAGLAAQARQPDAGEIASFRIDEEVVAVTDPAPAERGWAFVARVVDGGTKIAILAAERPDAMAGDTIRVSGSMRTRPGRLHRSEVVGWMTARHISLLERAGGVMGAANSVRSRVHGLFAEDVPTGALMRGFLIGDTAAIPEIAIDEMKRAGLVHFVAVSGGNVALFLGAVWLGLGVIPLRPRLRAGLGLAAVVLFVLITRWEPSVVRAGLMIGLVLGGRLAGVPIGGWTALGCAVGAALLVSPELLADVGFQLSVLATSGLMLGSGLWDHRRPRPVWRALAGTLSAQLAVSPLLIASFGSVPAFSAVTNLFAAPLVTAATALGWAATFLNAQVLAAVATWIAAGVLELSRLATSLPQVGIVGVGVMVAAAGALSWRPVVGGVAVATLAAFVMMPAPTTPGPVVVFLDVGQGDAVLVRSASGLVVAVDTGPSPIDYAAALRRQRVSHIDLLVLTHSDADHVGGLDALGGRLTVGQVWRPSFTSDEEWNRLLGGVQSSDEAVRAGATATIDGIRLSVLSPARRFAGDNDGSIVLWIEVDGVSVLLGGDVEAVAQRELPSLRPDILLVPHHGSRTTDTDWLQQTVGGLAVLSYGEGNTFGHPAPEVVAALRDSGVAVYETASGDVVIPLGRRSPVRSSAAVAPAQ
ncbi:MAG: MBL fold metallo-hydrolase [Acidimicrobiia bacterium]|nr:MBL fold metallo-hydrolase [Acidimicrobiia bacterium]